MKYLKILSLISCLSLSACQYDIVQHQKIAALDDLNKELLRQQQAAKERYIEYKAKGNQTGVLETSQIIAITKGTLPVTKDVVNNAKPAHQFIPEKGKQLLKPFQAFTGVLGLNPYIQSILGIATLIGGVYGTKKGSRILTRNKRIKSAIKQVKQSDIGGKGNFDYCSPQILQAMRLTLDKDDYQSYLQTHNCS